MSEYNGFNGNELIKQFTPAGVATGRQFIAPLGGKAAGGLAFDTSDNTLWIGTFGQVFHVTTTGEVLGSFDVPVADGRHVDGPEFQGASQSFTSIASSGTPVPGGTDAFASFPQSPAASGGLTAFLGLTTAIPGGTGTFTGFTSVSTSLGHTAFLGHGGNGQAGIYLASTLKKVIAVGDTLQGETITALRLGSNGLDGSRLGFAATLPTARKASSSSRSSNPLPPLPPNSPRS